MTTNQTSRSMSSIYSDLQLYVVEIDEFIDSLVVNIHRGQTGMTPRRTRAAHYLPVGRSMLLIVAVLLVVACSADSDTGQAVTKDSEDVQPSAQTVVTRVVVREVAGGGAKRVPLPKSLEELISGAEIIAVGRVGRIVREVAEGGFKVPPVKQTLVPHTYFELELEQVIRDDGTIARGETVLLRMSGTAQDGPIQVGEGKFMDFERPRMPKTGERRLFVLGRNPNDSYGSGRRGLLDIDGDVVRWAATHNLSPVGFAAGKTPEEFIAEVKEIADMANGS